MSKFHIGKNGKIGPCSASTKICPLGGIHVEANSLEEAQQKFDKDLAKQYSVLAKTRKPDGSEWDDFDKFLPVVRKYLPDEGEGNTQASQAVTAINKLVYKSFNDGDVFDNSGMLERGANDLSSYANWLDKNIPETRDILEKVYGVRNESEYNMLLYNLSSKILNEETLSKYDDNSKIGTIYECEGSYACNEFNECPECGYEEDDCHCCEICGEYTHCDCCRECGEQYCNCDDEDNEYD